MDSQFLRTIPFLTELTDEELVALVEKIEVRIIQPKQRLIEEGKPVGALYIIAEGVAHVRRKAQKREVLLGRLERGAFLGEINMFDPGLATASVYAAVNELTVFQIQHQTFRDYLAARPTAAFKILSSMMAEMAKRLRRTDERLVTSVYWSGN